MSFTLKSVFISDEVDSECVEILRKNGVEVVKDTKLHLNKEQFLLELPKYDGLIVRSATKVTSDVINAATNLKIIGRAGTGVDNIDCDSATSRGIIVMKDIARADASMKAGTWDRKNFMGSELYGKTLVIIGLGRIGKEVALRMQSFGMKTIGYDPVIPGSVSSQYGVQWMELEELWPIADYITVHTPLIEQTKNLLNEAVFAKCKKGVKVVNVARGGIIDEAALLMALNSNQCGGAGLDVFVDEPPKDYVLAKHPKVIATPHLGANTVEAQKRVAVEIAQQFVDFMKGKCLFGAVNAQSLQDALSPVSQSWVELGRCLGTLIARLGVDSKKTLNITLHGEGLKNAGKCVSAAVLSGFLNGSPFIDDKDNVVLNLVSAPALAKQLHITAEVKYESMLPASLYHDVIIVNVEGQTVSGTTSGGQPLLISVNGLQFSPATVLSGSVIMFRADAKTDLFPTIAGVLSSNGARLKGLAVSEDINGTNWGIAYIQSVPQNGLCHIESVAHVAFAMNF